MLRRHAASRRLRRLTEEDQVIWESFSRQVRPLHGQLQPEPQPVASPASAAAPILRPPAPAPPRPMVPLEVGTSPGGIDRATWARFRAGKLPPERTLDLHGRTVQRAHAEFIAFIGRAVSERLRCIEVITGRGSGEHGGAIRREFSVWLNQPEWRPLILAAAHPHAANTGSVRLLLRRVR